jgi:F-box protein 9
MSEAQPAVVASIASANDVDDKNSNNNREEASSANAELWFQEDERWELTWPIWHMLSRTERKTLALKHGYKTIGEFEEYMSLQAAVGDSSDFPAKPYDNKSIYPVPEIGKKSASSQDTAKQKEEQEEEDYHDDAKSESDEQLENELRLEAQEIAAAEDLSAEELLQIGGMILLLPDDMLHRVFEWLPVDSYGMLALVSPHWKSFTRTETVYKLLCERLYLNQSKKRQLHVSRFGNSYRNMLEKRPRVRAGGGVYVMKYCRIRKIQRDMWTEVCTMHGTVVVDMRWNYHGA